MKMQKLALMVATLAMVLGMGNSAVAQEVTQEPTTQEEGATLDEASCQAIFREEQTELATTSGVYPTSVSEDARACEDAGFVNPYPIPYFYDSDGFIYTYDPVADRYTSNVDPDTGFNYIYDLVTKRFYTYDPASGVYV